MLIYQTFPARLRVISALDTPFVVSTVTTTPPISKDTVNTGMHSQCLQPVVMFDHLINSMKAIPLFSNTSRGLGAQLGSQTERSYISVLRPQIGS